MSSTKRTMPIVQSQFLKFRGRRLHASVFSQQMITTKSMNLPKSLPSQSQTRLLWVFMYSRGISSENIFVRTKPMKIHQTTSVKISFLICLQTVSVCLLIRSRDIGKMSAQLILFGRQISTSLILMLTLTFQTLLGEFTVELLMHRLIT